MEQQQQLQLALVVVLLLLLLPSMATAWTKVMEKQRGMNSVLGPPSHNSHWAAETTEIYPAMAMTFPNGLGS